MNMAIDVTDKVCNLECVQDGKVHEFTGPVKIVLIDPPPNEYYRKVCGAAFVQLANMTIGAVAMILILFTMYYKLGTFNNIHILLCTIGYQVCVPVGILMCHSLNGASAPMRRSDKRFQHLFLEVIGVTCGVTGGLVMFLLGETSESDKLSLHFFFGAIAGGLAILAFLSGPITQLISENSKFAAFFRKSHLLFGIPAFIASSVCFILGILRPGFEKWVPAKEMLYAVIACCVFYTVVITMTPAKKFIKKHNPDLEAE